MTNFRESIHIYSSADDTIP